MAGLKIVEIPMSKDGEVPKEAFKQKVSLNGREMVEDKNTNLWPNFLSELQSLILMHTLYYFLSLSSSSSSSR